MTTLDPAYPDCWDECTGIVKDVMSSKGADVTVSTAPPLITNAYTVPGSAITCPHGVDYYMEPTSEQIAQWAKDSVQ